MKPIPFVGLLFVFGVAVGLPQHETKELATRLTDDLDHDLLRLGQEEVGIYNGNATTMNTHRYLVIIQKNGAFRCTGGIVSESWILTTGDCTYGLTVDEMTVLTSSKDGLTGKLFNVSQVVTHPDYSPNTLDYEFSCVEVVGHFYYWHNRSHLMPSAEPTDYMQLMVGGYGYTSASSTELELHKAEMTWLPKSYCETVYANYGFTWTDRMACANNSDLATLCSGDYGDSFVLGRWVYGQFIAVAKSGMCTDSAKPVILTDISSVTEWIVSVTGARYHN